MAEAGVTGVPPRSPKFFCHKCNQEIPHVLDDFTCPICKGGFIEEVQENSGTPSGNASQSASGINFDLGGGGFDFLQLLRGMSDPTGTGGGGGNTQVRFQSGPNPGTGSHGGFHRARSEGSGATSPGGPNSQHFSFVFDARPTGGGRGAGGQNNQDNPMEHVLFTFLNDLITGLGGGAAVGGTPVLSNFGDYAWGREGLDTIVTQLMNQMEGTGPPPLATDKIETLPDRSISQEQVDRKLQCSVCWDDFHLEDNVKQLECDHLFHPDCIIPWLKLHGTCPICRKDLTGQLTEDTNASPSARFEPMNLETSGTSLDTTNSSSMSSASNPENRSSSDSPSTGRPTGHRHPTGNNPNNPAASLFNQILDPILAGLTGSPSSTNQPGSGQNQSQNPRDRRQGRGGGLDDMDLDFD